MSSAATRKPPSDEILKPIATRDQSDISIVGIIHQHLSKTEYKSVVKPIFLSICSE